MNNLLGSVIHVAVGKVNRDAAPHGSSFNLMKEAFIFEVDHGVRENKCEDFRK